MKNKLEFYLIIFGLLILCLISTNVALANTIVIKSSPETLVENRKVITVANNQHIAPSNLRCWQEGRLLFEEINLTVVPSKADASIQFEFNDSKRQLHLMKIGDATCMYRSKVDRQK